MRLLFAYGLTALALANAITPSSFFSADDKKRVLNNVFVPSINKGDPASIYYGIMGHHALGEEVKSADALCPVIQQNLNTVTALNELYFGSAIAQRLKCKGIKLSEEGNQLIKTALESEETSVSDLFHAALAKKNLGGKVDYAVVLKNLQANLKKDDNVLSLGLAFQLASQLEGVDAKPIFDRIEDAIVQADEVDGKMLQFEGGLSATDIILSGAYQLSEKVGKNPPITKTQAVKFSNYLLNRKSANAAKGAYHLVNALNTLTKNKYHIPVAVTLGEGSTVVSESSPKVTVRVTDLFGKALGTMDVTVESAMRQNDGTVILSKTKMSSVGSDGSVYQLDLWSAKPGRGFYELTITAEPAKPDQRYVGNVNAILVVKALGSVTISDSSIGVVDADQSTVPKLKPVTYPNKLTGTLEADHHHKIILKFAVKDQASSEKVKVHQAFVRLSNPKVGSEIIFVAEPDSNSDYKFDLNVNSASKDFASKSGVYEIHLIIGDAIISNPTSWHIANVNVKFPDEETAPQKEKEIKDSILPEIKHKFREPEKRPAAVVSNVFTVLCLLPFFIMVIAWLRIGVNVSGFTFSLTTFGFHLGLGSIFFLYYYFWLQLDMFTTLKYLVMLGIVTFLCGNSVLRRATHERLKQQ